MPISYEGWVQAVFDHPVSDPEWYWEPSFEQFWDSLEITPELTVAYLTRLYRDPAVIKPYSLEQVGQAIWFLVGEASPGQPSHALLDQEVPLELRLECIRAIQGFFAEFVASAALGSGSQDTDAFQTACYMWWDIFPMWGDSSVGEPELKLACLDVMKAILGISSDLCQLSALHGVNHWHRRYGQDATRIIDDFLATGQLSQEVREYAAIARVGGSQ